MVIICSRGQQEIHQIHQELRALSRRWKESRQRGVKFVMAAVDELRVKRERLKCPAKAERYRRKRK